MRIILMLNQDMNIVKINQFVPFSPFSISVRPNICVTKYDGRVMLRARSLNRSCPGCWLCSAAGVFKFPYQMHTAEFLCGHRSRYNHCPLSATASILMNLPRKTLFIITSAPSQCSQGRTCRGLQALLATANRIVIFRIFP